MATTDSLAPPVAEPPPLDPEIFDDEPTITQSGRLADLLRLWNQLVRGELGTVQSFPVYDRIALNQQRWHQWLVGVAAVTGTLAVLLAIFQMAKPRLFEAFLKAFEYGELLAAVLALVSVVVGLSVAFHTRWQLLRMKAEQYRFLKFHVLLHAGQWLNRSASDRDEGLRTLLAGIHALDKEDAHEWSIGVFSLVADDPALISQADEPLTDDIVRYFRVHRLESQRNYFETQSERRHERERTTWMIPPACFFLSILCAFIHFGGEAARELLAHEEASQAESPAPGVTSPVKPPAAPPRAKEPPDTLFDRLLNACLIGAVAFPVIGAMVRTIRTAFEFGRNANRFAGVARILTNIEEKLAAATSPAVKLELMREAEFVLQQENRSWMRLMFEAEWFG
jgi:hypothetical protein